jgi:hypothetical protein
MPEYDPKRPDYHFGAVGGVKPLKIQDGYVYDVNGNSLDAKFQSEHTAVHLIQWLYQQGYAITPEARSIIIREKKRVALERAHLELQRQQEKLIAEETARVEYELSKADLEMRAQVELHLQRPEEMKPPLPLTDVEREILGVGQVDADVSDLPELEDLIPEEMAELESLPNTAQATVRTKASRTKAANAKKK